MNTLGYLQTVWTSLILVVALLLPCNELAAQSPPGAEPIIFSRQIAHAERSDYQEMRQALSGTGFVPVSAQSPANSRYNVIWHKDGNVERYAIHTDLSRKEYEDKRDEYKKKRMQRSFVTAYSDDGDIRYNGIWIKEKEERARLVHSKLSEKELKRKLKSYNRKGYSPVDIMPWRHGKKVYYSAVWIKDKRNAAWIVDVSLKEWDEFHKQKRQQGYSLRDVGMLGASKSSGVRYSGVWVEDKATRTHYRNLTLTSAELGGVLNDKIRQNYRVSDLDSVYVGDTIRFSIVMHRPARRNRLVSNFEIPEDIEDTILTLLDEYRMPGNDGNSGNVGFFVENYESGRFIAYNPDEHYFMSSTRKVILGASAIQNGLSTSSKRNIDLDSSAYRYDARGSGTTVGGIPYPVVNLRRMEEPFSSGQLLAAMLVESDNTAADYFFENWAGMREMRATLESTGTRNFGEMISKCQQERRSLMTRKGYKDLVDVRCRPLREWVEEPQRLVSSATPEEREILDGKNIVRSELRWQTHINKHYNAITPRTFAGFFRALADGSLLDRDERAHLLRHMGPTNRLFGRLSRGNNRFDPQLFDQQVAKNGATFRNRAWVAFTWDWRTRRQDFRKITPKHGFVFLTENHNSEDPDRSGRVDNLTEAIFNLTLPTLEAGRKRRQ